MRRGAEIWKEHGTGEMISGGIYHTVGLCADGTVVAVGNDYYGQCEVYSWDNIRLP